MTTIAYKDGIIACDSLITYGDIVTDYDADKRYQSGDIIFFMAGTVAAYSALIDKYTNGGKDELIAANAIVIDGNGLWKIGSNADIGFWKTPLDKNKAHAIGCGEQHAWTAMDMGTSAKKAVEMAALRDIYTGGAIKEYVVFPEIADGDKC